MLLPMILIIIPVIFNNYITNYIAMIQYTPPPTTIHRQVLQNLSMTPPAEF